MNNRCNYLTICCLAVLAIGCSGSKQRNTTHSFQILEQDTVAIADNSGGPKYIDNLFTYERVLTLRQNPDNEESMLFRPSRMTMDDDANIYVVDNRNYRIAVFNPAGEFLHSFGNQGRGPGEFRSIRLVSFDGEVLQLWDSSNRRLSRFSKEGAFIDDMLPPQQASVTSMILCPGEQVLTTQMRTETGDGYLYVSARVLIFNDKGDTIATVDSNPVASATHREWTNASGSVSFERRSIPFSPAPSVEYANNLGFFLMTGATPEIQYFDLSGNLKKIIRLGLPVRKITAEMKRLYEDDLRQGMQEAAISRGREPMPFPEQVFPEEAAFWHGGFLDDQGYLWLFEMLLPGEESPESGIKCLVVDPEGRFLGRTTVPNARATVSKGKLFAIIEDTETGEQVPTVFRIRPAVSGLRYPN